MRLSRFIRVITQEVFTMIKREIKKVADKAKIVDETNFFKFCAMIKEYLQKWKRALNG